MKSHLYIIPKKFIPLLLLVLIGLFASGCSTYSADRYAISVDNREALKASNPDGKPVSLGEFTATEPKTEITCRAVGPVKTPDGQPFSEYIRKSLEDELKVAEMYSKDSDLVISGNLDNIDFNSNGGSWMLSLTVMSNNGESFKVDEVYDYKSSWYGETACNQTAQALMPAVQDLIRKVTTHSTFSRMINK